MNHKFDRYETFQFQSSLVSCVCSGHLAVHGGERAAGGARAGAACRPSPGTTRRAQAVGQGAQVRPGQAP
eukprot:1316073-Pyramimonas_sp.AAC.1